MTSSWKPHKSIRYKKSRTRSLYEQKLYTKEVKDIDDDDVEISSMVQTKINFDETFEYIAWFTLPWFGYAC